MKKVEKEFQQINSLIERHWARAIGLANAESLMTYWAIGAYVSAKLKTAEWGSKVIEELCDFLKTHNPKRRGFGKRHIYNMVKFYDTYTGVEFDKLYERLRLYEFVQSPTAQMVHFQNAQSLQLATARLTAVKGEGGADNEFVQSAIAQIDDIEFKCEGFPLFLSLTSFTNHIQILNYCRSIEEHVFYILYSARERLDSRELTRALVSQTYESVMSKEKKMSRRLKEAYPTAEFMLKDKAFVDFLRLPPKHNEHQLRAGLLEHMKEFVLEMGKDFLYMGNEYYIHVGDKYKRLDLLFYHRSLQCLVDVELKSEPFKAEHVGKMDLYLEALDREVKRENENPSVGIILCPKANSFDVAYTLNRTMSPMMVAEYRRLLIPEEVMKKSLEEYCAFMKKDELRKG